MIIIIEDAVHILSTKSLSSISSYNNLKVIFSQKQQFEANFFSTKNYL